MNNTSLHIHSSHPEVIKRLKRANGHLSKVIEMIEDSRPCLEIAQQFQSVYNAIGNAKQLFVYDHIEGCIESADNEKPSELKKKMKELKEITKYL
ncbi:metal-sensing transcriptional repressor [Leptospira meyeri]|uniref:metal-sensing transcriptional repressor n=1 Tax=Leptospira meyeri TaxID=29508 RepID=UPI000C29F89B|nr:metal-sensing transcriptional repressor [Leptospira meyeri]PJZ79210.1 nickel resistance protein [Leptospira meyeri]PJZ95031.1 nickel resistance protein [Leptospira meyeri]